MQSKISDRYKSNQLKVCRSDAELDVVTRNYRKFGFSEPEKRVGCNGISRKRSVSTLLYGKLRSE